MSIQQIDGFEGVNVSISFEKFFQMIKFYENDQTITPSDVYEKFKSATIYRSNHLHDIIDERCKSRSISDSLKTTIVKWASLGKTKEQVDAHLNGEQIELNEMFPRDNHSISWKNILRERGYEDDFIDELFLTFDQGIGKGEYLLQYVMNGARQVDPHENLHGDIVIGDHTVEIKALDSGVTAKLNRSTDGNVSSYCAEACEIARARVAKYLSINPVIMPSFVFFPAPSRQGNKMAMDEYLNKMDISCDDKKACMTEVVKYIMGFFGLDEIVPVFYFKPGTNDIMLDTAKLQEDLLPMAIRRYMNDSKNMILAIFYRGGQYDGICDYIYSEDLEKPGVLEEKLKKCNFKLTLPTVSPNAGRGFSLMIQHKPQQS